MSFNRQKLSGFSGNSAIDRKVVNTSADYVMQPEDDNVIVNAAGHTVHLPLGGGGSVALEHSIYAQGVSTTVDGNGALINGAASIALSANEVSQISWDPSSQSWIAGFMSGSPAGGGSGLFNTVLVNGQNNNVNTNGFSVVRSGGNTAAAQISGWHAPSLPGPGQTTRFVYVNSTNFPITIQNENAGSIATQRIQTLRGVDVVLPHAGSSAAFVYDSTVNRWVQEHIGTTMPREFNVRDFGATGNGVTDDTAAIQAAIAALPSGTLGQQLHFPAGEYLISGTLLFDSLQEVKLSGVAGQTGIVWNGAFDSTYAAPIPAVHLQGCQDFTVENILVGTAAGKRLAEAWRLTSHVASSFVSMGHTFINCLVGSTTGTDPEIELGWRIGGGDLDANNDFHMFVNCKAINLANTGWEIQDSQCFDILFTGSRSYGVFNFNQLGIAGGSPIVAAGSLNVLHNDGRLGLKDVGKWIEITDDTGAINRTTITTPVTGTTVTLTTPCANPCTSGHAGSGVTTGTQCGIASRALHPNPAMASNGQGGNFHVLGGTSSGNLFTSYFTSFFNTGSYTFDGTSNESSRHFLVTTTASSTRKMCTVNGCRISGDGSLSVDPQIIKWNGSGKLHITNTNIGDVDTNFPIAIYYAGGTTTYDSFVLDDVDISTNLALVSGSTFPVFPGLWPTDIRSTFYRPFGGAMQVVGNRAPIVTAGAGAVALDFSPYRTLYVQLSGGVPTFSLAHVPEGLGDSVRVHIINPTGSPITPTWANTILWEGDPPGPIQDTDAVITVEFSRTADTGGVGAGVTLGRLITPSQAAVNPTLAAAVNHDIAIGNSHFLIVGATGGAFALGGFAAPVRFGAASLLEDGFVLEVFNKSGQIMTITNADAGSAASNRIQTLTGADVVLAPGFYASFRYQALGGANVWVLGATR